MNGSNGARDAQEEARQALKALLHSVRAKNEGPAASGYPTSSVSEEEAGTALRSRFRHAVHQAMRPPAAAARLGELEAQVSQLLDRPPPQQADPGAGAGAVEHAKSEQAESPAEEQQGPSLLELAERSLPPCPPASEEQARPRQPRRLLIQPQQEAEGLRNAVEQARQRLFALDNEVTGLTRQLKLGRGKLWTLQQDHSEAEKRISGFLASHASELSADALEEERTLKQQQQELRPKLEAAKENSSRWYSEAKHQDGILEPEREAQKGGAQWRILVRHPILRAVGEIFLATYPEDNDSEDGYPYEGGRPPSRAQQHTRRSSDSSEDDEDDRHYPIPRADSGPQHWEPDKGNERDANQDRRAPPPPAAGGRQQYRMTRGIDADDDSDGSSMPSPSGESGSMSAMLERSEEGAASAMQPPSPAAGAAGPTVTKAASRNSSDSDDSEDEALARNAAHNARQTQSSGGSGGGVVPALPLSSAGLTAGRGAAVGGVGGPAGAARTNQNISVETAEEVESENYSDDIEEEVEDMETSRSC